MLVVWLLARNSWLLGLLVGCGLWLFVGLLIVLFRALIGCCLCVYVMCMFIIAVISCCCLFDFGDLCGCVGLIVGFGFGCGCCACGYWFVVLDCFVGCLGCSCGYVTCFALLLFVCGGCGLCWAVCCMNVNSVVQY